tara:strand:- start:5327 stop:5527 length:201 start_codon:yes stop_codon:yes gene_type:complete
MILCRDQNQQGEREMDMQSAMAAKAAGQVLTAAQLAKVIARAPEGPGSSGKDADTNPHRQRQVGLG